MARIKSGVTSRRRHKKILKLARGYYGAHSRLFRPANETVMKALWYSLAHRRKKKGDFRRLWIARINAAARINGMSYSRLINGLKKAGMQVNRKMLSDIAISDAQAFTQLVQRAKQELGV